MAVKQIVMFPDPVLETPCEEVTVFDKKLAKLLNDMYETMIEFDGVGLAAPQIGISKQIAVVDIDDEMGTLELINPRLLEINGSQVGPEGCLSFPGLFGDVERPFSIKVEAQNRKGKKYIIEAEEYLARAILHEMDHLDGVLFTSKVIRYLEEDELEGVETND
ncbi:peptide deformylase [Cytobacillus oceanisediminis]|uniref:Peptide deformylase n=2 Tax=Niallia TaxID=2837506 RepID=A0A941G8Q8_NIACI|nr:MULTISPECIES: peptide deformylase [Bacillaceae]EOR26604.1 peptide deformylase [Niallia nealsonii AAU1]MBQ6448395.1 peptide deformylase [Bacillus sp. (in: firmicutes)]MDU1846861.1 peptide deformylase [Niallia nealsonii]MBZ9532769.1 peptide deformylase [Cytobacillus oceanisediminis]MCB5235303.1 peptide deformylase [Niallia circulans]